MALKSLENRLVSAVCVAAAIWFYLFSPWTAGLTSFWLTMSCAAIILTAMAVGFAPGAFATKRERKDRAPGLGTGWWGQLLLGVAIAAALWGIFWVGGKLSFLMFGFARGQVEGVYAMKTGLPDWAIAGLLLCVIGPAEEYFWRGFVQQNMAVLLSGKKFHAKHSADLAFVITALIYALVHVWSMNFMLVMAALVAGCVWGFLYRLRPGWLPALVISHALWDAAVFVLFPI